MSVSAKILAFYLALGPVYWIPGFPLYVFIYLKSICLLLVYLIAIFKGVSSGFFEFPCGIRLFRLFLVTFVLLVPGVVFGSFQDGFYQVQNFLQVILFVYSCNLILKSNSAKKIVCATSFMFFVFSVLSLVFIVFSPDLINPFNDKLSISDTGFGGLRTGWSPANALFVPWLLTAGIVFNSVFGLLGGVSVLIANQVLVGGRAGLLASVVVLLSFFLLRGRRLLFVAAVFFIVFGWYGLTEYTDILRVSSIRSGSGVDSKSLDDLSSGRVGQYFWVFDVILKNTLSGVGFGNLVYSGVDEQKLNIHNDFLKMAGEGGLLYAVSAFSIIFFGIYKGYLKAITEGGGALASFLSVVAGFVVAQFEPGFIFGNFNTSCFWWFCFTVCVSSYSGMGDGSKFLRKGEINSRIR
jgi:hypothetical protein